MWAMVGSHRAKHTIISDHTVRHTTTYTHITRLTNHKYTHQAKIEPPRDSLQLTPVSRIVGPQREWMDKGFWVLFIIKSLHRLHVLWAYPPRVQVSLQYRNRPNSKDIGTRLRPRYIPYNYMDPLGIRNVLKGAHVASSSWNLSGNDWLPIESP